MKPLIRIRSGCPDEAELAALALALTAPRSTPPATRPPASAWRLQARLGQSLPPWGSQPSSAWLASRKARFS